MITNWQLAGTANANVYSTQHDAAYSTAVGSSCLYACHAATNLYRCCHSISAVHPFELLWQQLLMCSLLCCAPLHRSRRELLYLGALFFQGGGGGGITGFINNVRSYLWIPVSQDAYRRISLAVFAHVLDLDLSFHLKRKTGEVTKVVDRGTNAIQNVLSTIVFQIAPQVWAYPAG